MSLDLGRNFYWRMLWWRILQFLCGLTRHVVVGPAAEWVVVTSEPLSSGRWVNVGFRCLRCDGQWEAGK